MANGIITAKGRELLCKAHSGEEPLSPIAKMAFGSGGVDAEGKAIIPTGTETALRTELLQKEITSYAYPTLGTCRYMVKLAPGELVNCHISEQGLFDAAGNLIIYQTFLSKGIDEGMNFAFDMDETFIQGEVV